MAALFALALCVAPWSLARSTNTLRDTHALWRSKSFDDAVDAVLARRTELGAHPAIVGGSIWMTYREGLAFELDQQGLMVQHGEDMRGFVDDARILDRATVTGGILLAPFRTERTTPKARGKLVAVIHLQRGVDPEGAFSFGTTGIRLYVLDRHQVLDLPTLAST
jgi:hypothetical protein